MEKSSSRQAPHPHLLLLLLLHLLACASHIPIRSGVFGSGLVTLSCHAITRHGFWRYAAGGFATNIGCGDYYAGKGVRQGQQQCGICQGWRSWAR
jgi:hypothetical protein